MCLLVSVTLQGSGRQKVGFFGERVPDVRALNRSAQLISAAEHVIQNLGQPIRIRVLIGDDPRRAVVVLDRHDRDPEAERLKYRRTDSVAEMGSQVDAHSAQGGQELIV